MLKTAPLSDLDAALPGPRILQATRFADERGHFSETYNRKELEALGISCSFIQDNESLSSAVGTIRGLHFQIGPVAQTKLVRVARGAVFDVAVDIREGSPTFGQYGAIELSAVNGRQLFIPAGFAHGFCTLEPETLVIYKVDRYYSPEHDRGIRWDDPTLAVPWPLHGRAAVLSKRDQHLPLLSELETCFTYEQ